MLIAIMNMEEPTQLYKTTFQHIHYLTGFAVSDAVAGKGKGYTPKSRHACLDSGYWCENQVKEDGEKGIVTYLKRMGVKNSKTVIKALKKL